MTVASAARTALCGWFGFSETGSLASVDDGAPSVHRFYKGELFGGAASAWLDSAARAVATVLVAVIVIVVDDADGGSEDIFYYVVDRLD